MREYKVLTELDRVFLGGFEPTKLESALNDLAAEGWRLVEAVQGSSVWKSMKAEVIFILERQAEV